MIYKNIFDNTGPNIVKEIRASKYFLDAVINMIENDSLNHADTIMQSVINNLMLTHDMIKQEYKDEKKE